MSYYFTGSMLNRRWGLQPPTGLLQNWNNFWLVKG